MKRKLIQLATVVTTAITLLQTTTTTVLAQDIPFDNLDPLRIARDKNINTVTTDKPAYFNTPGGILSRVLDFAFPLAGIILFVMIIWGGFEILSGATTPKAKDAGKQRVTNAVIGFILLFSAYWIAQLVEVIFGIQFLSF